MKSNNGGLKGRVSITLRQKPLEIVQILYTLGSVSVSGTGGLVAGRVLEAPVEHRVFLTGGEQGQISTSTHFTEAVSCSCPLAFLLAGYTSVWPDEDSTNYAAPADRQEWAAPLTRRLLL